MVLKHVGGADWAHETVVKFLEDLISDKAEQVAEADVKTTGVRPRHWTKE